MLTNHYAKLGVFLPPQSAIFLEGRTNGLCRRVLRSRKPQGQAKPALCQEATPRRVRESAQSRLFRSIGGAIIDQTDFPDSSISRYRDQPQVIPMDDATDLGSKSVHQPPTDFRRPWLSVVTHLQTLVESGARFSTVYADPPWPYSNTASRGAAENHYPTMSLKQIQSEPVKDLVTDKAHLHLWTTNAFLSEALDVIRAWGFTYKSCLLWIKPQIGMGNYWRVSHEFLLLGVRGRLPFHVRTICSWQLARRIAHSRKPYLFRGLIEQVSPGPYLELYGRQEQPDGGWTVYGNQVERRLF